MLIKLFIFILLISAYPVFAGEHVTVVPLLQSISAHIINPLIILLFAAALVYFFWGIFKFVSNIGGDEARETGKKHMLWGIIGLFIMVGVYGILLLVLNSLGVDTCHIYIFGSC